jgi:3-methyladenine DNA glycosylase AlkC
LRDINKLIQKQLQIILNEILKEHKSLVRKSGSKWYVEDSDFGLGVKSILEQCELIEKETIND